MYQQLIKCHDWTIGRLVLVVGLLVSLGVGWLILPSLGHIAAAQGSPLHETLLQEGQTHQVLQFNPDAALQKRIFADKFVPNSPEFTLSVAGSDYAAQRAENLGSGFVRVYYVRGGDWSNVQYTQGGDELGTALLAEAQRKQVIQFNPQAALQRMMFADGFVPNSSEFQARVDGTSYSAQRAENLGTGEVRVYYVANGNWANVRNTAQTTQQTQLAPQTTQPPAIVSQPVPPTTSQQQPPSQAQDVGAWPCATGQVKGNRNSGIYHAPGERDYARTYANVACFDTEAQAQAAGFRRAQR